MEAKMKMCCPIWFAPIRTVIDISSDTFYAATSCPSDALRIDLLAIEPNTDVSRVEPLKDGDCKPVNVLWLCGKDAVSMMTVLKMTGRLAKGKRFNRLFFTNPAEGLKTITRLALKIPAQGESEYFKLRQFRNNPDFWTALQDAASMNRARH